MAEKDRTTVIEQVQKCWRLAEDPAATPGEREAAVKMAQKLMAKYAIDEISLQEKSGHREAIVMANIRITEDGRPAMVKDQRIALAYVIARNNRCRGVIRTMAETADPDTGKRVPGGTFLTVVGYASDTHFVREFYAGLVMDMMAAMLDEKVKTDNYRVSFCAGYVTRIDERLVSIGKIVEKDASEGGMALVLVDRKDQVDGAFDQMFPNVRSAKVSRRSYDPNAIARGSRAAESADIGQGKMGTGSAGEVGAKKKELGG